MRTYHYRLARISAMVLIAIAFGTAGLKAQDVQKEGFVDLKAQDVQKEGFVDPKTLVDENARQIPSKLIQSEQKLTDVKDRSWVNPGIMVEESVLPEESIRATPQKLTAEDLKITAAKASWADPGLMASSAAISADDAKAYILLMGDRMEYPIVIGTYGAFFSWSNTKNTGSLTNAYTGRPTNDVFYRLTLNCAMEVEIQTCGSGLADTYVTLLNSSGGYMETFDDVQTAGTCSSIRHEYVKRNLSAGTYYLVCEGWSQNGSITTQVAGRPGNTITTAINAGTYGAFFTWSDIQNTGNFTNAYTGRSTSDVFYRFTLNCPMEVEIKTCGSGLADTYITLLNGSGGYLQSFDDAQEAGTCSSRFHENARKTLSAGTYYLVCEGWSQNGSITTQITGRPGNSMATAINAGTVTASSSYTNTQNTGNFTSSYEGRPTGDVFYRFTLTQKMLVTLTHCGSGLDNTCMHLLDASGSLVVSNDDYSGEGACGSSTLQSFIQRELAAGTYYVVSEGYSQNGNIQTGISGAIYGDKRSHPVVAGSFGGNSQYSDTRNTTAFTNAFTIADQGRSTNDVFYRMTLTRKLTVTLTHCGSSIDTYMHLLDASGNLITSNDDYSEDGACGSSTHHSFIQYDLEAGTYYVVSEGFGQNGEIQTNITTHVNEFGYTDSPNPYSSEPEGVGSMAGSFDVSPTGAATFSIPIEVPPGVGGMQPSIAIVYNSQAGNGVAGWGCSMAGISAITRVPKDIYHDYTAKGITHGLADAFVLDGQRLMYDDECGVSEGGVGAVYHPENDPLTKVTIYGTYTSTTTGGILNKITTTIDNRWFQVEREGITRYYGRADNAGTTDSRQEYSYASGSLLFGRQHEHRINAWYLGYVKDVHGNYMVYSYDGKGDAGARYLTGITYGKNTGASSTLQNSVSFEYTATSRQDPITYVVEGIEMNLTRRLSGIACKTGNSVYRTYTLAYNTTGDGSGVKYSRLTSVTVKNGAGEALKPVTLNWSFLPSRTITNSTPTGFPASSNTGNKHYLGADLNGDGISDLVEIDVNKYNTESAATVYRSGYANGQVSFLPSAEIRLPQEFKATSGEAWQSTSGNMIIGNQGAQYVFKPSWEATGSERRFFFTLFNHFGLSTILSNERTLPLKNNSEEPPYVTGDVNNDGNDDFIYLAKEKTDGMYCGKIGRLKNFSSAGNKFIWVAVAVDLANKPEKLFLSDFDGNGMNDLLIFHSSGYTILWNTGNPAQPFADSNRTSGTAITDVKMIRQGDFNGDGLPDFIMNTTGSGFWNFALNRGNGTFTVQPACTLANAYDQKLSDKDDDKFNCLVCDFDNDGKSDVVITKAMYRIIDKLFKTDSEFLNTYTYWMRSTGTGLEEKSSTISNKDYDALSRFIVCSDFNGDGQPELINYGYDLYNGLSTSRIWRAYRNPNFTAASGRVTGIQGMEGTTGIAYGFMT
ncbi:MAG: FG-GAP-like repeat-containing protein, partial [Bacteroidales bacterium]|nr:FG-GAP-like repeat-containing protein [Bacteroidales bacterium]